MKEEDFKQQLELELLKVCRNIEEIGDKINTYVSFRNILVKLGYLEPIED